MQEEAHGCEFQHPFHQLLKVIPETIHKLEHANGQLLPHLPLKEHLKIDHEMRVEPLPQLPPPILRTAIDTGHHQPTVLQRTQILKLRVGILQVVEAAHHEVETPLRTDQGSADASDVLHEFDVVFLEALRVDLQAQLPGDLLAEAAAGEEVVEFGVGGDDGETVD